MTDIDPKALEHACLCAGRSVHHFDRMALDLPLRASIVAHARAIEQHEAFKREVSDAAEQAVAFLGPQSEKQPRGRLAISLARFIITKPDPLVEALDSLGLEKADEWAPDIRKALAARGLEIREKTND